MLLVTSRMSEDTLQLWIVGIFLLHFFNHHSGYINVDNIPITIINHAFAKCCKHEETKSNMLK